MRQLQQSSCCEPLQHAVPLEQLPVFDVGMLLRLQTFLEETQEAYEAFQPNKVLPLLLPLLPVRLLLVPIAAGAAASAVSAFRCSIGIALMAVAAVVAADPHICSSYLELKVLLLR